MAISFSKERRDMAEKQERASLWEQWHDTELRRIQSTGFARWDVM